MMKLVSQLTISTRLRKEKKLKRKSSFLSKISDRCKSLFSFKNIWRLFWKAICVIVWIIIRMILWVIRRELLSQFLDWLVGD